MKRNHLYKRLVIAAAAVASLGSGTAAWAQCATGYTYATFTGCTTSSRYFLFIKIGSETTCETTNVCMKNYF